MTVLINAQLPTSDPDEPMYGSRSGFELVGRQTGENDYHFDTLPSALQDEDEFGLPEDDDGVRF